MQEILVVVAIGIVGAALGSFAGAQVWRLRAKQLQHDKNTGDEIDLNEYKRLTPLMKTSYRHDRSIDLDTGKRLAWYDLIPIASWLLLRGRSRFTGRPIGWSELLVEVGLAGFFVASYYAFPVAMTNGVADVYDVSRLVLWLGAGVIFAMLVMYDAKWSLLPNKLIGVLLAVGVGYAGIGLLESRNIGADATETILSLGLLSGLYLILFVVSKGKWVGAGDIKLGAALALFVADWQLALMSLFLANLIGTILVLPGLLRGALSRKSSVPFGPMLIAGAVISVLWGDMLLEWYLGLFL